jgi:heat shock protein HslJ
MAIYAVQSETPPEPAAEAGIAPAIIGAPWHWVVTLYNDDTKVIPENSEDYVLELLPDGQLTVKADCNTAVGTYFLEDTQLSMQVTASTMMACGPESLGDQFIKDLNASQSYLMDGEDLIIVLKLDTGSMRLEVPEAMPAAGPSAEPPTPEVQPTVEPATPQAPPSAETGGGPADILGVIWKWDSFTSDAGEPVMVESPESYEFMLLPTGIIRIKADCNNGSGTHWIDADGSISIEVLALTRAACPPDSLSGDFVELLNQVSAYRVDEGNLFLTLGGDGGTMTFSPAE